MEASFLCAVRYWVEATCITPLRTAGADGDMEQVLTDANGAPFVQGTSIAGAMRTWLAQNEGQQMADLLFGSQKANGHLMVSEGRFSAEQATTSIRPRLRIDPESGSADPGGKFDVAQVNSGAKLRFELTWLGGKMEAHELDLVEQMLAALHAGEIRLGGQKSNGFGRLTLSVTRRAYDMRNGDDRKAWLNDSAAGETLALPRRTNGPAAVFTLSGRTDSILVKAAAPEQSEEGSVTKNLSEGGRPILPGSSVKGAVRARAALIEQSRCGTTALCEALFGRGARDGDNGRPGQVWFEDILPDHETRQKITRIRINRLSGGVIRQGRLCEEPLGARIRLTVTAHCEQPEAYALLLYALRDLGAGLYPLGSGGSIGRGYIRAERLHIKTAAGEASLSFGADREHTLSDPAGIVSAWMQAWKEAVQ